MTFLCIYFCVCAYYLCSFTYIEIRDYSQGYLKILIIFSIWLYLLKNFTTLFKLYV